MTEQDVVNEEAKAAEAETVTEADAPTETVTETETAGHDGPVNVRAETAVDVETITDEEANYPSPKGAFVFVILMLIFYVVYWAVAYFEIFILRGA